MSGGGGVGWGADLFRDADAIGVVPVVTHVAANLARVRPRVRVRIGTRARAGLGLGLGLVRARVRVG